MKHLDTLTPLCVWILPCLLSTPAWAQTYETPKDTDNAEVISLGQRIGLSDVDTLTSPSSLLTEADIILRGQANVADLLRSLPGLAVNQSGSAGSLTQIRVRGAEANQVLVLIDGVEVSNPNTGEFDFAGLRAEDIVRIEVLRGEQSALWGAAAIGGVINIITRAGRTQAGVSLSAEGGTQSTTEGQISAVLPLDKVGLDGARLSINGNVFNTDGFDISGLGGERDDSDSQRLTLGLNALEIGRITLNAKGSFSRLDSASDADNNFDGRLENTDERLITDTQTGRLDARFDVFGFENLVALSHADTETDSINSTFPNDTNGERTTLNWAAKRIWGRHNFTVLGETERERFSNDGGDGAFQNQSASIRNQALAGDYAYIGDNFSFKGSAREDFNSMFDNSFTWRVGAGYDFKHYGLGRLRASVGTGVKNPTLTELFGFFPGSFIGNPDLEPETSFGFNIGYDHTFSRINFDVSIDYFNSKLEDEVSTVFNPDFTSTSINLSGESTREGVEIEINWDPVPAFALRASATYLDAQEPDGAEEIRRPDFIASATATWQPIDPLSLTLSIDHTGDQLDTDFATFTNVTLDSFTLIGANAAYAINDHVTLTLRGENLADENYQQVVGFSSLGRSVLGGLRASF